MARATRIVDVDNQQIAYSSSGLDKEGTIVFLHGNSCSSAGWSHILEHDFGSKRLIVLDLPGHGESAKAGDPELTYSIKGLVDTVSAFIRRLQLKNVLLVGHSLGGHIAIGVALQIPVTGLFIFGTPPLGTVEDIPLGYNFSNPASKLLFQGELNETEAWLLAQVLARPDFALSLSKDILKTDVNFRGTLALSIRPELISDERKILKEMTVPVAIIHGNHDPIVSLNYLQQVVMPTLWEKQIFRINAGHSPHLENPKELAGLLSEFSSTCFGN